MGYYTFFELSCTNEPLSVKKKAEIIKYLNTLTGWYDERNIYFQRILNSSDPFYEYISDDTKKWSDYELHMNTLAKAFPEYCFLLQGCGEDHGDWWRYFAWGDKYQFCRGHISYEDEPSWGYGFEY